MLGQILIAAVMILMTTATHGAGTVAALWRLERFRRRRHASRPNRPSSVVRDVLVVSDISLIMFLAGLLEIILWAALYLRIGALGDFGTALYFSAVTLTSLGYGDVVLDVQWRVLSGLQAANGVVVFGWTTSVVFAAVREVVIGRSTG